jgi:hypothetical protein
MFSFFGLFADAADGLREQISETWPERTIIMIESPFSAVPTSAIRRLAAELARVLGGSLVGDEGEIYD